MSEQALTLHRNLPAMIAAYDEAKRLIIDGFAAIKRAKEVWHQTFRLGEDDYLCSLSVAPRRGSHHDITSDEEALKVLRVQTWSNIIDRVVIVNICSAELRAAMSESIDKDELGEPTIESVTAMLSAQLSSLGAIFDEKVKAVFNKLRPRGSKHKRNSEEEVPRSVVLTYTVEIGFSGTYKLRTMSYTNQSAELLDIESLFDTLTGKGHVAKSWKSNLQQAVETCSPNSNQGETEYFRFRCYKNGNLHLEFKRLDLLKRLNEIAGGNRLRRTKPVSGQELSVF